MDLMILNGNLDAVSVIDTYESFIWTDRYRTPGDFELYLLMSPETLNFIRQEYYVWNRNSEHSMIIESIKIVSDVEDGDHVTITGRSLESILDRRIVWGQKVVNGNLQNAIKTLLTECIISPTDPDRRISNFIFSESTDPAITELSIDAQYTGDNLLDVIERICAEHDIGFKITLNDQKQFVFKLYAGANRSYDQLANSYVVFSPKFDNIINSNYIETNSPLKTVTLVGGEGEGSERKYASVGSGTGLGRREVFTDARDISSDTGDEEPLSDAEYLALLEQRGNENLSKSISITSFEGQVETSIMFKYGEDFFIGDAVQIANEYGHEAKVRILEVVMSDNKEGFSMYPTFAAIT